MTTLRILAAEADAIEAPTSWALYDAAGACVASGRDPRAGWPHADALEVVLPADRVRVAAVVLPPIAPARVAAAAAFALEDQLAGPADEQWLGASRQQAGGRVTVAVVARSLVARWRARALEGDLPMRLTRLIVEPDLVPVTGTTVRWCVPAAAGGGAFVRWSDGSAFPVDAPPLDGSLPSELALALASATHSGTPPAQVRVDGNADDASLARWRDATGVPFVRGAPWQWQAADAAAFAAATNLLTGEMSVAAPPRSGLRARAFAPALRLVVAALALHVVATVGDWARWRIDAWRTARAWTSVATGAGVAPAAASSVAAARAALAERYAQARHTQGLPAPADALPLLARTAPALSGLAPGALKSATYADGSWTLDLQRTDGAALRGVETRLRQAGVVAIAATTQAGTRVRVGAP